MKLTSKETYKAVKGILRLKKFTQYQVSKEEKVNFHIVNRTVNWLIGQRYISKRKGHYEVINPTGILGLIQIYRKLTPTMILNIDLTKEEFLEYYKGKIKFCLTSALSYYDDYFRDPAIHIYINDQKVLQELKEIQGGSLHVNIYKEELNPDDFVKIDGYWVTSKVRTLIDLYCSNKAYAGEPLIRRELM